MSDGIVIIGASAAGGTAAREIRSKDKDIGLCIFSEESHYPYYRPYLTEYIGNSKVSEKSNFYILNNDWCREQGVNLRLGSRIVRIDTKERSVIGESGDKTPYDKLIIALGSTPFVPHQDALSHSNVFAIRTLDDAMKVHRYSNDISRAMVIGGGLLGLEAAYALTGKGVNVTIIELSDRLLPNQLDDDGSRFLAKLIAREKLRILLGKKIVSMKCADKVESILLDSGEEIETDMVIYSVGVRSNIALAREAGIAVNKAIVVDEKMQTSAPGVYACGDVAEYKGRTIALWINAVRQGKVAGINAAGGSAVIGNEIYPAMLNSFDTRVFSAGDVCLTAGNPSYRESSSVDADKGRYKKLFFKDGLLAGFILIGDISESQKLLTGLKNGISYDACTASY